MPLIPIKTVQKIGLFASKAGTPCSWNILLILDHFSYYHIQQNVFDKRLSNNVKNYHKPTWIYTQHTHAPLTVPNHASSEIVHRIFSYNMLQCVRHSLTPTDARRSTQTQPLPLTNASSAMVTHDINRNRSKLLCFFFGLCECMFDWCLIHKILFGNRFTHGDTNR